MPIEEFLQSWLARPQFVGAMMFLLFVAGLWLCCLGYASFRVQLTIEGLVLGVLLVHVPLAMWGAQLSGPACFLIYAAGGAALAAAAWFFFRAYVSLTVLALAVGIYVAISPSLAAGIIFGLVIGLGLAVLAWLFTRTLVIVSTALCGAVVAVGAGSAVVAPTLWPRLAAAPAENVPAIIALALAAAALAFGGAYVQLRYTSRLRIALAPPEEPAKAKPAPKRKAYVTTRDGRRRRVARPAVA